VSLAEQIAQHLDPRRKVSNSRIRNDVRIDIEISADQTVSHRLSFARGIFGAESRNPGETLAVAFPRISTFLAMECSSIRSCLAFIPRHSRRNYRIPEVTA
jgi:hypothetical protein